MTVSIHLIGTNFKHADLEKVARVQWPENPCINDFLQMARERFGILEIFFLQTCNRREFYFCLPQDRPVGPRFCDRFLKALSQSIGKSFQRDDFYHFEQDKAALHLFRVASSLESMVLGETEIMKQIRDQAGYALKNNNMNKHLNILVDVALRTAKQVRRQTSITRNVVSMASLAFRQVTDHLKGKASKRVVFVGAGHFINSILPTFVKAPDLELCFVNRSIPHELAAVHGGKAIALDAFLRAPIPFDVMISATSAPDTLFELDWIRAQNRELLLLDAALPRDIDPRVRELTGVVYRDLDHLNAILTTNRGAREAEIPKTQPIFDKGLRKLEARWLECDLAEYHQQISSHYREAGEKALNHLIKDQLADLSSDEREALRGWTQNLVTKLTNIPILGLKGVAKEGGAPAVEAYTKSIAAHSSLFKP